jgi:hypothetical protein
MNKPLVIGGITAALVVAIWYYYRRVNEIQQAQLNPNESQNSILAQQAAGYDRDTGQNGDTYTNNYRYSEYLQYLNQGGTSSGNSFDSFLTASQAQSLPSG